MTRQGQAIRFTEDDVRPIRATRVRGITLEKGDYVVGFDVVEPDKDLLVATTMGYGKRTALVNTDRSVAVARECGPFS